MFRSLGHELELGVRRGKCTSSAQEHDRCCQYCFNKLVRHVPTISGDGITQNIQEPGSLERDPGYKASCHWRDACRLRALGSCRDFVTNALPFLQAAKPFCTDCTEMHEQIRASVFRAYKPESFCIVKPFYCSVRHMVAGLVLYAACVAAT